MRQTTQNFLVGLVSLVAIFGFAYLLMKFGELDDFFHPRYQFNIYTDHAAGLRPGSLTEYNGVPIGIIDEITVNADPTIANPVRIIVLINHEMQVPVHVVPRSMTSLFGGSATLELVADPVASTEQAEYFPRDGTARLVAHIRLSMIDQLTAELDVRMKPVIEALDSFSELSDTYITFGNNLNSLIAPEDGDGEPTTWRETIRNLNEVLAQVHEAFQLAQEWLGDEQLRADLRASVENASDLIIRAASTLDRYARLADELEADADSIVKGLLPIADDVAITLEEVRRLTTLASEGEGTVAEMLRNPDLYNSLDDAAVRLERTLVEIQLYIEKIKAEGLDIDF